MENRFKLRITRMLRSSFGSCRTRNISDAVEKAVSSLENHNNFQLIEPLSATSSPPKYRSSPSIYKPRRSYQSTQSSIYHDCIAVSPRETLPPWRRKVSAATDFNGRKRPPASPISPLNLFSDCKKFDFYEKKKSLAAKTKKKKKGKRVHVKSKNMSSNTMFFTSSRHESVTYGGRGWWFSSEDETDTLFFSSRAHSSESSEYSHRRKRNTRRGRGNVVEGFSRPVVGKDKVLDGTFAVVKSSDDPYKDFRASMVEMIVERQIFGAQELEQLLLCFLSLNSRQHHRIIVDVFTEICETLFSNWS